MFEIFQKEMKHPELGKETIVPGLEEKILYRQKDIIVAKELNGIIATATHITTTVMDIITAATAIIITGEAITVSTTGGILLCMVRGIV